MKGTIKYVRRQELRRLESRRGLEKSFMVRNSEL